MASNRAWGPGLARRRGGRASRKHVPWQLVLAFRAASESVPGRRRSFWTPYPLEATSKSSLFIQAERISDAAIVQVLAECLV